MGYTTDFWGKYELDRPLDDKTWTFLRKLSETRRMKRHVDPKYGVEGEFYVDGKGLLGQDSDDTVVNYNYPPKTQPSLWCNWTPTEDKKHIAWNQAEKFYKYDRWLIYIIEKILKPRGYILNGAIKWQGEDLAGQGYLVVIDNTVLKSPVETWEALRKKHGDVKAYITNPKNAPLLINTPGLKEYAKKVLKDLPSGI